MHAEKIVMGLMLPNVYGHKIPGAGHICADHKLKWTHAYPLEQLSVAEPGFSQGGRQPRRGGRQIKFN